MSDVETITKPILLPLIRSGVRSVGQLTRDEQWAISIWATLRSIIFDALAPTTGDRYYSELDRFDLRTVITPPPNTHVWLAPFSGTLHNARFVVVNKVEVSEDYGFHVMTAVINQIAFKFVTWKGHDRRLNQHAMRRDGWDTVTKRVWPRHRRDVGWPPLASLDDRNIDHFIARFRPT